MTDAPKPGLFAFLRLLERRAGTRPRIGRNRTTKQELATLRQSPWLAFPDGDIEEMTEGDRPEITQRVFGLYGPQGALPLNTTEDVLRWKHHGDSAFIRFTDILASRFVQLFFRAWSDARAITQFDHPSGDRFRTYVAALSGVGTPAYESRDHIDDIVRIPMVGLHAARVKSPVRLRQMLEVHLQVGVEVEEHIPAWIAFEPSSRNSLGQRGSGLGRDMHLGAQIQTVGEKIRLRIRTRDMDQYRSFLPGGAAHDNARDIVFWYLGKTYEVEIALMLPADQVAPAALGQTTELGYMACIAPPAEAPAEDIEVSRFALAAQAA